jgi:chemotaxis protein CheZ
MADPHKQIALDFHNALKELAPILMNQVEEGHMDEAAATLVTLQHARQAGSGDSEFSAVLKEKAAELHQRIEAGEVESALETLQEMQDARDRGLYQEVGRLTRALHSAITNFHIDSDPNERVEALSEMTDATDRLEYVIELTEKAANTTLDRVEESIPLSEHLSGEASRLQSEWKRLVDRDMSADEFRSLYWEVDGFFDQVTSKTTQLNQNLSDILMAQDFQDLTGQVINRVTGLVKEVEASLVDLVFMASQVEEITGIVRDGTPTRETDSLKGEGPQINTAAENIVANQDDVDDLLSSLGF